MAILAVIVILNMALITLAVVFLLNRPDAPANPPVVPTTAEGALALPPTWTPAAISTPAPGNPADPAGCAASLGEARQGTLTRVIDRQTVEVSVDGAPVTAGLAGIIFPTGDAGLEERTIQSVRALAEGQAVRIAGSTQDSQGRTMVYLYRGDLFLNLELVRLGMAQADPAIADAACLEDFQRAEQQARLAGLGIWQPAPAPTKTFVPFVTVEPNSACDCSIRYECTDFQTHDQAQACYNACNDYNSRLDVDRDGIACEDLP
jgi:micrococcal nuclease